MKTIWIKIPGPPKSAQGRSKKHYLASIQDEAKKQCSSPLNGDVTVLLFYVLQRNHGKEPDLDNLTKVVLDAHKGVAYHDDQQVDHFRVQRFYCGEKFGCSAPALPSGDALQNSILNKEECTFVGVLSPSLP